MEFLALFNNIESASKGIEELVKKKIPEENITTLSSVHLPDGVLVKTCDKAWYKWFSVAGGVIGAIFGFSLATVTALLYPLYTGDKAIISAYPVGIITYEFTMLCAILGAFIGMVLEISGKRPKISLYDTDISDGMIGISITDISKKNSAQIKTMLKKSGAYKINLEDSQ